MIAGAESLTVTELGAYRYTIEAWVDHYKSWRSDLQKRIKAGQDVSVELVMRRAARRSRRRARRVVRTRKTLAGLGGGIQRGRANPLWRRAPSARSMRSWRR